MKNFKIISIVLAAVLPCLIVFIIAVPAVLHAVSDTVSFRDDFRSLENWRTTYFTKIKEHTEYSIETEGEQNFLKAESSASASGIVLKKEFSLPEYTKVRWRWKIRNVYIKGNGEEKAGDDYPMRVYIVFKYDPSTASIGRRLKYGLIRSIYGEYPPHSSLVYIWANHRHQGRIMGNAYAPEVKMVVLQAGNENSGKWVDQEINIVEDYQYAFGVPPPETWGIALMNDSDNTGESSVSYIDYIEVFR